MSGVPIVSCSVMDFDFSGLMEVLVPRVASFLHFRSARCFIKVSSIIRDGDLSIQQAVKTKPLKWIYLQRNTTKVQNESLDLVQRQSKDVFFSATLCQLFV